MDLTEKLNQVLTPALAEYQFQRAQKRAWVRRRIPGVRELFGVNAMKGTSYSCYWGFSLDFVPKYTNAGFKSKHTDKSAVCDLTLDPIDVEGTVPAWCSFHPNIPESELAAQIRKVIAVAEAEMRPVGALSDLESLLEARSKIRFRRFGLDNYIQTHLAWGLLCHLLGFREKGERLLEYWRDGLPISRQMLKDLVTKTLKSGFAPPTSPNSM